MKVKLRDMVDCLLSDSRLFADVSTTYDLGAPAGERTCPGLAFPSVVTHTSVLFGISGSGRTRWRSS